MHCSAVAPQPRCCARRRPRPSSCRCPRSPLLAPPRRLALAAPPASSSCSRALRCRGSGTPARCPPPRCWSSNFGATGGGPGADGSFRAVGNWERHSAKHVACASSYRASMCLPADVAPFGALYPFPRLRGPCCPRFRAAHPAALCGAMGSLEAIRYANNNLQLLDQRRLPSEMVYLPITNSAAAHDAISSMVVRGAPAIAICAALAVAIEVQSHAATSGFATGTAAARRVTPGSLLRAAPLTPPLPHAASWRRS